MTRSWFRLGVCILATWTSSSAAQSYRARFDVRGQAVSFRALVMDSVQLSSVVTVPGGGFETTDGHSVRCGASDFCFFSRPGEILRGVPVTTTASVILWGLGVPGLTAHAAGRFVADLGPDDVWPATEPTLQLIEGFLEYRRSSVIARAGRQLVASRLEPFGFDGASLDVRWDRASLALSGYGGWGLAQAATVSISSPALNPLDEWRPRDRQLVAGAEAAWAYRTIDARAEYRREIDPRDKYVVSERTAFSFAALVAPFRLTGGLDYNIAEGHLGSADAAVTYQHRRLVLSAGARRYRPYFSLWTLWSAFSPVPYYAATVSAEVRTSDRLTLRGRAERYRYDRANVSTALVPELETDGWRASTGGTLTLNARWTVDGSGGLEHGPGASARFADGAVRFVPNDTYAFDIHGGAMARPLELRYYDATSRWIGARGERRLGSARAVWADVSLVDDERDRPDASASSLSQVRVRTGVSLSFGSNADRVPLPPGRPRGR